MFQELQREIWNYKDKFCCFLVISSKKNSVQKIPLSINNPILSINHLPLYKNMNELADLYNSTKLLVYTVFKMSLLSMRKTFQNTHIAITYLFTYYTKAGLTWMLTKGEKAGCKDTFSLGKL